jgi:cohesin domain-containing protein
MIAGLIVTVVSSPVAAQLRSQFDTRPVAPRDIARISLGSANGEPGDIVSTPLAFSPPSSMQIGSVEVTITFDSTNLHFEKAEPGPNVNLASEIHMNTSETGAGQSVLTIRASVPAGTAKGIPRGTLGDLKFRIDESAAPVFVTVKLNPPAKVTEIGSKTPLSFDRVRTSDAEIFISAVGGLPGCFFFTH